MAEEPAELSELLMRVARTQRRRWRDVLAPWDLSPHQARALKVVCEHERVRLSDLAEILRIAPRSATEVADALEERGLVARTPDPGDRRVVLLHATEEGRQMRAEVDRARTADSEQLFARLSPSERATLSRLLRTLADEAPPG